MSDMIHVTADGGAVDARRLEMHDQEDPYPGGARYTLSVDDKELIDLIGRRVSVPTNKPSRAETNWVFNMLRLHVSLHCGRGAPLFWANSIETIDEDAGTLTISGLCSPHVEGRPCAEKNGDGTMAASNRPERTPAPAGGE